MKRYLFLSGLIVLFISILVTVFTTSAKAATPTPSCNSGKCREDCLCHGNTPSECNAACMGISPPPRIVTPTQIPTKAPNNTCKGSCEFYADGCKSGYIQTAGQCDPSLICCELKPTGPAIPSPTQKAGITCQGKCEYYLEGCRAGYSSSNNSCGSDKLICCELKTGAGSNPFENTAIPDCDGSWVPKDITCIEEGQSQSSLAGFTCCRAFNYQGNNIFPSPDASGTYGLYGFWNIPITSCSGTCEWGSASCSVFNKLPAYGTCPGQKQNALVACCGENVAAGQGNCLKGNNYCEEGDLDNVQVCRLDKKGYQSYPCADGYFCPTGGSHCIPKAPGEFVKPKVKLFQPCQYDFECTSNYCGRGRCDLNTDELNTTIKDFYVKNYKPPPPDVFKGYLIPGWTGLSPAKEAFINEFLDDIYSFDAYCDPGDIRYDIKECGDSVLTGLSLGLMMISPELVPVAKGAPKAIVEASYKLYEWLTVGAARIPDAGLIGKAAKLISKWAIPAATAYDAKVLISYQQQCSWGDMEACAKAQDFAIMNFSGWTAYTWNVLPEIFDHPQFGRMIDVNGDPTTVDFVFRAGYGSFGATYIDEDTGTVTKIFFNPGLIDNKQQFRFYDTYGGSHPFITFKGPITNGSITNGFQQEYFPNTISLGDFLAAGNKFKATEIQELVDNMSQVYAITGRVHGDLFRPPELPEWNLSAWGNLHPGNFLIQTLDDGTRRIIPVDFAGWNGSYRLFPDQNGLINHPDSMRQELEAIEAGLKLFMYQPLPPPPAPLGP